MSDLARVIRKDETIDVLERVAIEYLTELGHALEQAKIAKRCNLYSGNETCSTLELRVRDLRVRYYSLKDRLENIGVL